MYAQCAITEGVLQSVLSCQAPLFFSSMFLCEVELSVFCGFTVQNGAGGWGQSLEQNEGENNLDFRHHAGERGKELQSK